MSAKKEENFPGSHAPRGNQEIRLARDVSKKRREFWKNDFALILRTAKG
jgi:hypothetical protein